MLQLQWELTAAQQFCFLASLPGGELQVCYPVMRQRQMRGGLAGFCLLWCSFLALRQTHEAVGYLAAWPPGASTV